MPDSERRKTNAPAMGGILAYAGKKEFIGAFKPSPSMGVGLLGAGISVYIGEESDKVEGLWHKEANAAREDYDNKDSLNGINKI